MINREIRYERNLTGSFLIIPTAYQGEFDEKMMLRKKISGMLPVERCFYNNAGQYWYNITGFQSLETRCHMKNIEYGLVEKLLFRICEQLERMEMNLISPETLILDPEYIFISNNTSEISFLMYPGTEEEVLKKIRQLMDYLLLHVNHAKAEAIQRVYGLYELILNDACTIPDIKTELIRQRDQKLAEEIKEEQQRHGLQLEEKGTKPRKREMRYDGPSERKGERQGDWQEIEADNQGVLRKIAENLFAALMEKIGISEYVKPRSNKEPRNNKEPGNSQELRKQKYSRRERKKDAKKNQQREFLVYPEDGYSEPEEEYIPEVCPTVCIPIQTDMISGVLEYQGEEGLKDIELNQLINRNGEVRIGKGENADVPINHATISRIHARISKGEDGYYIEDLNSMNGTYLNEELLPFRSQRKLNRNDMIQFADVIYRVK